MAIFYYNRFSDESIHSQWMKHFQMNAYLKDVDSIIAKNKDDLKFAMDVASDEQRKAFKQVCGTLEEGFKEVSQHLKTIDFNISGLRGEINEMASMLDWKLSLLIEEQKLTNLFLKKITHLLRIPESQKQRVYYIEEGLKYLKSAMLESVESSFYDQAHDSFEKAAEIAKDFFTLNKLGQIHLYSKKYYDPATAEYYFLQSAREAFAESNVGGTTTSKHLQPNGNLSLIYNNDPFKAALAEAYVYAGRACYLQENFSFASKLAGEAYNLIPDFLEAGFEQAKYLVADGQDNEAVKILKTVISKDRYFSIKTLEDGDLIASHSILKLLDDLHIDVMNRATKELISIKDKIKSQSKAMETVNEIQSHIHKNSYLAGMKALDLLSANYTFPYENYVPESYDEINVITLTTPQPLLSFIKLENNSGANLERLKKEAQKEAMATRRVYWGYGGLFFGAIAGFFVGGWLITVVVCTVIGITIGSLNGMLIEPKINKK